MINGGEKCAKNKSNEMKNAPKMKVTSWKMRQKPFRPGGLWIVVHDVYGLEVPPLRLCLWPLAGRHFSEVVAEAAEVAGVKL